LQILQLGGERLDLGFEAIEAPRIGGIEGCGGPRVAAPCRSSAHRRWRSLGERFERTHDHLHVDQLFFQLLDSLPQCRLAHLPGVAGLSSLGRRLGGRQRPLRGRGALLRQARRDSQHRHQRCSHERRPGNGNAC
jgi:hypothetical protein